MKLSQPFCFCSCNHLIHKRGAKTSRFPKEDGVTRLQEMAQRMNPPPKTSAGDAEQVQPDQGFKIDSAGINLFGSVVIWHMFFKSYFAIVFFFKEMFFLKSWFPHITKLKHFTTNPDEIYEICLSSWYYDLCFFENYLKKLNEFFESDALPT